MKVNIFFNERRHHEQRKRTKHHIIARSHSYSFRVDKAENIAILDDKHHKAFHTFFQGALTPKDQLTVMYNLISPVVSNRILRLFDEMLDMEDKDFYRPEMLKNKKRSC